MHYDFENNEFNKSKILEKTEKDYSKVPSMRKKSMPANIEIFNTEGADMDLPYELTLSKHRSVSREEYEKRILQINSRNSALNAKIGQIHGNFDKTYEANKLLLECQLKEVSALKNSMIERH